MWCCMYDDSTKLNKTLNYQADLIEITKKANKDYLNTQKSIFDVDEGDVLNKAKNVFDRSAIYENKITE